MSQAKIDQLKAFLESIGLTEGEGYDMSGSGNDAVISVTIPLDEVELPEELQPFAWDGEQVSRAMWKGNADKNSWNGANFEIALREYASDLMRRDPETIALAATLDELCALPHETEEQREKNRGLLDGYQASRQEIWDRICSDPKIVAWEKDLEENYL